MASDAGTQMVLDALNKMSGGDPATVKTILDIAQKIDFAWFEWAIKVGLVALAFLFFKDGIYNLFRYALIRWDRFVGIGAIVKFDGNYVGRIKEYDFRMIVIETAEGYVRIPLEVWMKTYWVQLKGAETEMRAQRKQHDDLELKYYTLEQELKEIKNSVTPIAVVQPNPNPICPPDPAEPSS